MSKISLRDAIITFKDAGANSIEIKVGDGNLTWEEARTVEYTNDRGILSERRLGDDVPMSVSLDMNWDYIKGLTAGSIPSPIDALKQLDHASTWVSTDTDLCQPYAIDIIVTYEPACTGTDTIETITLPKFTWESLSFDLDAGSIAVSGTCLATESTAVRSTPV